MSKPSSSVEIRTASAADAPALVAIFEQIASERVYSAIDRPWTLEQQRGYLESMSPREVVHVAVTSGHIVGCQTLDRYSSVLTSMSHVGATGTFLLPDWRRRGVGRALFTRTQAFARQAGYRKLVIHVRASNASAQAFYRGLGFVECGRLARQVVIDGQDDDEVLMECFL